MSIDMNTVYIIISTACVVGLVILFGYLRKKGIIEPQDMQQVATILGLSVTVLKSLNITFNPEITIIANIIIEVLNGLAKTTSLTDNNEIISQAEQMTYNIVSAKGIELTDDTKNAINILIQLSLTNMVAKMNSRKYYCQKDIDDERDYMFARVSLFRKPLPKEVDLRNNFPPVYDQLTLGSCTSNGGVGFREFMELKTQQNYIPLSRLYLYYKERELEGSINEDSGAQIRDLMKVMVNNGICPEVDFPYDISKFAEEPSQKAESDAGQYKIKSYQRLGNLTDVQRCLVEGFPVVVGMKVYESFESDAVAQNGIVPLPKMGEKVLGGHCILAVGYKYIGKTLYLIIRNSWGQNWGENGYCYIPTSFIDKGIIFDMWTGR